MPNLILPRSSRVKVVQSFIILTFGGRNELSLTWARIKSKPSLCFSEEFAFAFSFYKFFAHCVCVNEELITNPSCSPSACLFSPTAKLILIKLKGCFTRDGNSATLILFWDSLSYIVTSSQLLFSSHRFDSCAHRLFIAVKFFFRSGNFMKLKAVQQVNAWIMPSSWWPPPFILSSVKFKRIFRCVRSGTIIARWCNTNETKSNNQEYL